MLNKKIKDFCLILNTISILNIIRLRDFALK